MNKIMEMIAAEKKAAEAILEGKAPENLTAQEVEEFTAHVKKADELNKKHLELKSASETLDGIATEAAAEPGIAHVKHESLGKSFVHSDQYREFRKSHRTGFESKNDAVNLKFKAEGDPAEPPAPLNTTDHGNTAPLRLPGIEDVTYHRPNTLLQLITQGTTNAPWIQYRQLTAVTNNAKITKESKTTTATESLKPLSTLTTRTEDAVAYTYADGVEATNQELTDDGALAALIDGILRQNLTDTIEDKILNGDGGSDEPTGILNTTGLLEQAFDTDIFTTVRRAKTALLNTSRTIPQALLLNPEDNEAIDLTKDAEGRFYGAGPFAATVPTLWAVPRIESAVIPKGTALMGDFSQVHLLVYEALSVVAFNQHKDYAQRNLTYIRAELRALQLIRQPAKLARISLAKA